MVRGLRHKALLSLALLHLVSGRVMAAPPPPPHLLATPGPSREVANLTLSGVGTTVVQVFAPLGPSGEQGEHWEKQLEGPANKLSLPAGRGGYHWLAAVWQQDGEARVAATAHFFPLPGPSPARMLAMPKQPLELVPHPLPREHQRYRGGESWPFLARFAGQPLVAAAIYLYVAGGPPQLFLTDDQGLARVTLPIPAPTSGGKGAEHGRHGPQTPFILEVSHRQGGKRYATTFSHTYGPPAARDLPYGMGLGVAGFVLGGILLHRRRATP